METERDRKIRERAYELWEKGGRQEGDSEHHWLSAEMEFSAGSESPTVDVAPPGHASASEVAASATGKPERPAAKASAGSGKADGKKGAAKGGGGQKGRSKS